MFRDFKLQNDIKNNLSVVVRSFLTYIFIKIDKFLFKHNPVSPVAAFLKIFSVNRLCRFQDPVQGYLFFIDCYSRKIILTSKFIPLTLLLD